MRKQKDIPCPLDSAGGWSSDAALAISTSPVPSSYLVSCLMPFCSAAGLLTLMLVLPWFQLYSLPSAVRESAGALSPFRSKESF